MTRSEQREEILILTFEKTFNDESIDEIIELAKTLRGEKVSDFVVRAVNGIFDNLSEIDSNIEKNSINWKLNRIPKVPLCIMRLAVYEMLFENDIPQGVSINEAVELAKKYGADEDSSYINGVLGSIAKSVDK